MTTASATAGIDHDPAQEAEAAPVRMYVFCPEEPEKIIFLRSGRKVQFTHGRLDTVRDKITMADVEMFARQEMEARERGHQPPYIVTHNPTDIELYQEIWERVVRMVGRRAHSSDFARIMEEARLELALMLASDDGMADTSGPLATTAITKTHPSMKVAIDAIVGSRPTPTDALERDRMVIERSAAQGGLEDEDDVEAAKASAKVDAALPPSFSPPPEATAPDPDPVPEEEEDPFA